MKQPANDNKPENVLGKDLKPCCLDPITGFYRDGFCRTDVNDFGVHTICVIVSDEFLEFSQKQGNDLITPNLEFDFPGLKEGDKWCLCISRWVEALKHEVAPPVVLESSHKRCLEYVPLNVLKEYQYKNNAKKNN